MRVSAVLVGLTALVTSVAAAPSPQGMCLDDMNCLLVGGSCVKAEGAVLGKCVPGTTPAFSGFPGFPTTFPGFPPTSISKVSEPTAWAPWPTHKPSGSPVPHDIAAVAARVATRSNVPENIAAIARSIVARHDFPSLPQTGNGGPHWSGKPSVPHWPIPTPPPQWSHWPDKPAETPHHPPGGF